MLGVEKNAERSQSLREPGPVWPCVSVVAKCVSIVANRKNTILTRFTTMLTRTRAGLALRKGARESLLSLRGPGPVWLCVRGLGNGYSLRGKKRRFTGDFLDKIYR